MARSELEIGEKMINLFLLQRGCTTKEAANEEIVKVGRLYPRNLLRDDVRIGNNQVNLRRNANDFKDISEVSRRLNLKINAFRCTINQFSDDVTETDYVGFHWNLPETDRILHLSAQLTKKQIRMIKGIIDLCLKNRGLTSKQTIEKYNIGIKCLLHSFWCRFFCLFLNSLKQNTKQKT